MQPSAVRAQSLTRGAESIDPQLDDVPRMEEARGRVAHRHSCRRAGRDDVAREQRHELADVADQEWNAEDEVACRTVLLPLSVDREPHRQIVHVADFVWCSDKRTERRE